MYNICLLVHRSAPSGRFSREPCTTSTFHNYRSTTGQQTVQHICNVQIFGAPLLGIKGCSFSLKPFLLDTKNVHNTIEGIGYLAGGPLSWKLILRTRPLCHPLDFIPSLSLNTLHPKEKVEWRFDWLGGGKVWVFEYSHNWWSVLRVSRQALRNQIGQYWVLDLVYVGLKSSKRFCDPFRRIPIKESSPRGNLI